MQEPGARQARAGKGRTAARKAPADRMSRMSGKALTECRRPRGAEGERVSGERGAEAADLGAYIRARRRFASSRAVRSLAKQKRSRWSPSSLRR